MVGREARLTEEGGGEGRETKWQSRRSGVGEGGLEEPASQEPGRRHQAGKKVMAKEGGGRGCCQNHEGQPGTQVVDGGKNPTLGDRSVRM